MNPPYLTQVREAVRRVQLFFVLMAAILISGIAASYFAGRAALQATGKVRQSDAVIEAVQGLRSTVQDAETGQRGYLLTRDASYLTPYETAIATIQQRLDAVRKLAGAGGLPAAQVNDLEGLIDR